MCTSDFVAQLLVAFLCVQRNIIARAPRQGNESKPISHAKTLSHGVTKVNRASNISSRRHGDEYTHPQKGGEGQEIFGLHGFRDDTEHTHSAWVLQAALGKCWAYREGDEQRVHTHQHRGGEQQEYVDGLEICQLPQQPHFARARGLNLVAEDPLPRVHFQHPYPLV